MRKLLLFFLSLLVGGTMFAQGSSSVTVIENLTSYQGTDTYVFNKADGKVYVRNTLGNYERYGLYEKVTSLKITQPGVQEGDYITAPDGAYINLNYIPKNNTRAVAVIKAEEGPDWKAVYGCGYERDGWRNRFCFFSTNATINLGGETGDKSQMVYGQKIWTVLDAAEGTMRIYDDAAMTNQRGLITDQPKTEDQACKTPLYIFAQNKDYPADEGDRVQTDCYNSYVTLYNLKIYEGDQLIFDLVPVLSEGKGALKDKVSGNIYKSANDKDFYVGGVESGISVYEGKMVYNTTDGNIYKYTNGDFVNLGARTLGSAIAIPEGFVDYRNMNNWETNNDHKSIYEGKIAYDESTGWNTIAEYIGTGGYEPLMVKIATEEGADYNLSYKYKASVYDSWCGKEMRTFVVDFWDLGTNYGENLQSGLANYMIPFAGTNDEEESVSVDFTANQDWQALLWQFGLANDGKAFSFAFGDIQVKKYAYPEAYATLNPFGPQLLDLIPTVEAYTGETTTALKNDLDAALVAAKAVAEGDDLAAQKEALEALQNAFNSVKDLNKTNFSNLKKTIALAKAEGVETAEAEAFIETGKTNSELDAALKNVRIARKQNVAERQPNVFKGNVPAEGEFYLYNVGQQRFLTGGSDWGAHAALGMPGTLITLEASGAEDGFFINTHLANGSDDNGPKEYLNYRGYMDCSKIDDWRFVEVADGKYNIYQYDYSDVYVKYNPDASVNEGQGDWNTVGTENHLPNGQETVDPEDLDAQWILVTPAEREALLDNATVDNPVDATFYIVNPGFNQRAEVEPSWMLGEFSVWGRNSNHNDFVLEAWNKSGICFVDQLISVIKPGFYEVSVQGYYRDGSFEKQSEILAGGGEAVQMASFYANNDEVLLPNISKCANMAPGLGAVSSNYSSAGELPNSCDQAAQYFQNGLYKTSVITEVGNDGLSIGLYMLEGQFFEGDWVVVDNFRLKYYGTQKPAAIMDTVLPSAQQGKIFNLQGVEVKKAQKPGLYISNGKKFVVK
jgi:hypothetical protein